MSTETAAADHNSLPPQPTAPYAAQAPNPYEMEKRIFNTGPCANKTHPTAVHLIGISPQQQAQQTGHGGSVGNALDENPSPTEIPMPSTAIPSSAENNLSSSNISGGDYGGSGSDKELEAIHQQYLQQQLPQLPQQPQPVSQHHTPTSNASCAHHTPEGEKKTRKRRRPSEAVKTATPPKALDRFGKLGKITEFIANKTSPKRSAGLAMMTYTGGQAQLVTNGQDSSSNELTPLCISPTPGSNVPVVSNNNRTPVVTTYSGNYASSDSNQSPPSSSRMDNGTQTEMAAMVPEMDGSTKFLHQLQQDKIKEELLKANKELNQQLEVQRAKVRASKDTIKRLLIRQSRMERKQAKEKCMENTLRVGQFKPIRRGEHFKDEWTEGYAMEEIDRRLKKITQERIEIQNATQNLRKRKTITTKEPKNPKAIALDSQQQASTSVGPTVRDASFTDDGFLKPEPPKEMTPQEYMEQEEIYRLRKEHLKREESELMAEKDRLERERNIHIREMKRVQYEESSRFREVESLNNRYLLLQLLGKGGFSEVWQAFDLEENRYVACKIHHVNKEWKEDKKANYVKHAMREKDIHKLLDHPRIVRLFDLFTIDSDTFCTVLEYCDGNDLDFYLKQHKQIPEKEARLVIMQIVNALKYLSERKHPIIHYDLKPANILLSSGTPGEIKITDFGLSKELESEDDDSIELTSQGAGTYWYLPPETFRTSIHGEPPSINLKVDVWSVGVIFYQCLYGKRPFGHEHSQQRILQENIILNATEVTFPSKPPVSATAHDFIRRCLQCKKEERADINELARHELFKPRGQMIFDAQATTVILEADSSIPYARTGRS